MGDLLDLVLKPEMIKNLLLIVNLDWEQPWDFLNELRKWLDFWQSKVWDVIRKLPLSE